MNHEAHEEHEGREDYKMKRFFKWLGIVIAVFVVTIIIYMRIAGRDIAPSDFSDLIIEYKNIPAKDNAFTYLNFSYKDLYYPSEDNRKKYNDLEGWIIWDEQLANEVIEKNKSLFERLDRAIVCKSLHVPRLRDTTDIFTYSAAWRNFARLNSLYSRYLQKTGKEKEAFEQAIKIIHFGYQVQDSGGGVMHYLVGTAIKSIGDTAVRRLLAETSLSASELKPYIEKVSNYETNIDGLVNSLKEDYRLQCNTFDGLVSGKLSAPGTKPSKPGYYFKINETKALLAVFFRVAIQNAKADFSNQKDFEAIPEYIHSQRSFILSPNKGGQQIVLIIVPAIYLTVNKKFFSQMESRATQIMIALKCYKTDNGDLPESLDQLVPNYLKKIPEDPYDGKPMKYSKEKRIVYSVGEDQKDTGGPNIEEWDVNPEMKDRPGRSLLQTGDPAFKIDF